MNKQTNEQSKATKSRCMKIAWAQLSFCLATHFTCFFSTAAAAVVDDHRSLFFVVVVFFYLLLCRFVYIFVSSIL